MMPSESIDYPWLRAAMYNGKQFPLPTRFLGVEGFELEFRMYMVGQTPGESSTKCDARLVMKLAEGSNSWMKMSGSLLISQQGFRSCCRITRLSSSPVPALRKCSWTWSFCISILLFLLMRLSPYLVRIFFVFVFVYEHDS